MRIQRLLAPARGDDRPRIVRIPLGTRFPGSRRAAANIRRASAHAPSRPAARGVRDSMTGDHASHRLRIALLVHDYNRHAGHSRYVAELASRFRRDHDVHVFTNTVDDPDTAGITF